MKFNNIRHFLLLVTVLILSSCATNSCKQFKTGDFKLSFDKLDTEYIIVRNDSMQIEYNTQTGEKTIYYVDWISECESSLRIKSGRKEVFDFYSNKKLTVEILECTSRGYRFRSRLNNEMKWSTGSALVIHNDK